MPAELPACSAVTDRLAVGRVELGAGIAARLKALGYVE